MAHGNKTIACIFKRINVLLTIKFMELKVLKFSFHTRKKFRYYARKMWQFLVFLIEISTKNGLKSIIFGSI